MKRFLHPALPGLALAALLLAMLPGPALAVANPNRSADLDQDGDVDFDDILQILADLRMPAVVTGNPAVDLLNKDLDEDGTITILDARAAVLCCTRALCASGGPPTAVDDSGAGFSTDEDTAFTTGNVLLNDTDPDPGSVLAVLSADAVSAQGAAVTDNGDGTFGYDPTGVAALQALGDGQMVTDTFDYTVTDGVLNDAGTVSIKVTGSNDAPTITAFSDQVIDEDASTGPLPFTIGDAETAAGALVVTATSSNTTIIPNGNLALGGAGASRTIDVTPAPDQNGGPVTITVTVDDGTTTTSQTFDVTVTAVNDPPTITMIADQVINEDASTGPLPFTIGDAETAAGALIVTATSSNTTIIPNANLVLGGVAPNLTIDVTPAANQNGGPVTITVTVDDGATMVPETFDVTVTAVPDPPAAVNDMYTTAGNVEIAAGGAVPTSLARVTAASGVLANDSDPVEMTALTVVGINGTALLTGTSTLGGDVTMNADGTFVYVPPVGVKNRLGAMADTFTYTVQNGAGGQAVGTVSIDVVDALVWFVHNDPTAPLNPAGGDGRSSNPFDTLGAADAFLGGPSLDGDTIFVFEGDGTTAGQNGGIRLRSGQKLIGHKTATHTFGGVVVDVPNPPTATAVPPSTRPLIGNAAGDAVRVLADLAPHLGVEVRGLEIAASGNAIDVTSAATHAVGIVIDDNRFVSSGTEAIDLNPGSSGLFTATVSNNVFATASPTGNAIDVTSAATAGQVEVAIDNNADVTSAAGTAIHVDGSAGTGTLFVTGFAGNSVHGNPGGTGIEVVGAVFDADPTDADFDLVAAGTTTVGTSANPVGGAGVVLGSPAAAASRVSGNLSFAQLDVAAGGGSGLRVAGAGVFVPGPPDAGFQLGVTAGTVSATGGPALDLDPATVNATFGSISSTASPTTGVRVKDVDGSLTIGNAPPSLITGSTGTAFEVDGGRATVSYGGVIDNASGFDVEVKNRPAMAGDVTFSNAIGNAGATTGSGISVNNNAAGNVTFSGAVDLGTGANNAVTLASNAGAVVRFNGGLTAATTTGIGFQATGGGTVEVCSNTGCNAGAAVTNSVTVGAGAAHAVDLNGVTIGIPGLNFSTITAASGCAAECIDADGVTGGSFAVSGLTRVNGTGGGAAGIDVAGSSAAFTFDSIDVDATAGAGVALTNNTGTVTINGGDVSGAAGTAFDVDMGNNAVIYNGTINNASGRSVEVTGRTGAAVTFGGMITDTGTGIFLDNNGGGSNPVISFAGGIDLDQTAGTSFVATNGGEVRVTDTGVLTNAVDNTGGKAVEINGVLTAITFDSLSSTGSATEGVRLANLAAGSSFTVNGATTVDNATAEGIELNTVGAGSTISFGATTVNNRNATGVFLNAVQGTVDFGATTVPNPNAAGGHGIHVEGSSAAVTFATTDVTAPRVTNAETFTNVTRVELTDDGNDDGDGIFLRNNTGSFTSNGGTIQDGADDGIDLRNVTNVTLDGLTITQIQQFAIQGRGVSGLTVRNASFNRIGDDVADASGVPDNALWFTELSGTSLFEDNVVDMSLNRNGTAQFVASAFPPGATNTAFFAHNRNVSLNLTVRDNTIQNVSNDGIQIVHEGTGAAHDLTVLIDGTATGAVKTCVFQNWNGRAVTAEHETSTAGNNISLTVRDCQLQDGGLGLRAGASGSMDFRFENNVLTGLDLAGNVNDAFRVRSFTGGNITAGRILNNTINVADSFVSFIGQAGSAILKVDGNSFTSNNLGSIGLSTQTGGSAQIEFTNNDVLNVDRTGEATGGGIVQTSGGGGGTMCIAMTGNKFTGNAPTFGDGFLFWDKGPGTLQLEGFAGGNEVAAAAFLNGNNQARNLADTADQPPFTADFDIFGGPLDAGPVGGCTKLP